MYSCPRCPIVTCKMLIPGAWLLRSKTKLELCLDNCATEGRVATSPLQDSGFTPEVPTLLVEIRLFSPCLQGFPLGYLGLSHRKKKNAKRRLGDSKLPLCDMNVGMCVCMVHCDTTHPGCICTLCPAFLGQNEMMIALTLDKLLHF